MLFSSAVKTEPRDKITVKKEADDLKTMPAPEIPNNKRKRKSTESSEDQVSCFSFIQSISFQHKITPQLYQFSFLSYHRCFSFLLFTNSEES